MLTENISSYSQFIEHVQNYIIWFERRDLWRKIIFKSVSKYNAGFDGFIKSLDDWTHYLLEKFKNLLNY